MVFSFILNDWNVVANFLQSLDSEFQTMAPLYAEQFWPCFVFSRGGRISNSEMRSDLFVTEDTLLKKVVR